MNLGIERRKIEDKIVAQYETIDFNAKNGAWIDGEPLEEFIFSFFELRRYYETTDDITLGLEALRVYMDGLRALQAAAVERKFSLDRRESAQRLIYELNYQVEAVMYELDRNRQEQNQQPPTQNTDGNGGIFAPN